MAWSLATGSESVFFDSRELLWLLKHRNNIVYIGAGRCIEVLGVACKYGVIIEKLRDFWAINNDILLLYINLCCF